MNRIGPEKRHSRKLTRSRLLDARGKTTIRLGLPAKVYP